jgi:hypothetical protein
VLRIPCLTPAQAAIPCFSHFLRTNAHPSPSGFANLIAPAESASLSLAAGAQNKTAQ